MAQKNVRMVVSAIAMRVSQSVMREVPQGVKLLDENIGISSNTHDVEGRFSKLEG